MLYKSLLERNDSAIVNLNYIHVIEMLFQVSRWSGRRGEKKWWTQNFHIDICKTEDIEYCFKWEMWKA